MIRSRVKTIIIILLLLTDFFLSAVLLLYVSEKNTAREKTAAELGRLLSGMGITLVDSAVGDRVYGFVAAEVARATDRENAFAGALFAGDTKIGSSAGRYEYSSGPSAITVDETGSISGVFKGTDEIKKRIKKALAAGKEPEGGSNSISEAGETLEMRQLYKGLPVFNCMIKFANEAEGVISVSGRWVFGNIISTGATQARDVTALLLDFALASRSGDLGVSKITSAQTGYIADPYSGGTIRLTPVCRIETDAGIFYMDALTGRMTVPE